MIRKLWWYCFYSKRRALTGTDSSCSLMNTTVRAIKPMLLDNLTKESKFLSYLKAKNEINL